MRKWVGLIIQKFFFGYTIGCDIVVAIAALLSLCYRDDYLTVGLCVGLVIMAIFGHIFSTLFVFLGARLVLKVSGIFKPRLNLSRFFEDWPDQDTNKFLLFKEWNLKRQENFLYSSYGIVLLLGALVFVIAAPITDYANMYIILATMVIIHLIGFKISSKIFHRNKIEMDKWIRKDKD